MPNRRQERRAERESYMEAILAKAGLESWNSFVTELPVPSDIAPALISSRAELLKIVKPRALSAEECATLYKLIGGLLDTNNALREHAKDLAQLVDNWEGNFKGLASLGFRIKNFANFKAPTNFDEDDVG